MSRGLEKIFRFLGERQGEGEGAFGMREDKISCKFIVEFYSGPGYNTYVERG